jgi:hypothetical protein
MVAALGSNRLLKKTYFDLLVRGRLGYPLIGGGQLQPHPLPHNRTAPGTRWQADFPVPSVSSAE